MSRMKLIIASLSLLALAACATAGKDYHVWYLEPEQGLVRKQVNEVLPFPKAKGYLCANQADFGTVTTCIEAEVRIYYLSPERGLVRKQSGEVRSFNNSRGFLCVSPADFQQLREDCAAQEHK